MKTQAYWKVLSELVEFYSRQGSNSTLSTYSRLFVQFLFDHLPKNFERLCANDRLAVYQEGRRAGDAKLPSCAGLRFHGLRVLSRIQTLTEGFSIQSQRFGETFEIFLVERPPIFSAVIFEQGIVVLPEGILITRCGSITDVPEHGDRGDQRPILAPGTVIIGRLNFRTKINEHIFGWRSIKNTC